MIDDQWRIMEARQNYNAGRDTCEDRELLSRSLPGFSHLQGCKCEQPQSLLGPLNPFGGLFG
jgi:hypothetical protein